ncbi:MAG: glycosyltransferase family 2 protein [Acidobacteria bacterium]|nr:glycosyltransferase family 2 protein [Acidobacteriota bacterium]
MPRVTVLMPAYNRERFVDEAIRSVVDQDFADFELLIVDDGSTDETPAILREWAARDARIRVVTLPSNEGIPSALNAGLAVASAPYIARLDSDDLMMPRRLAEQFAVLDAQPDVILVSCAYELMDVDGRTFATWRGDEPHDVVVFLLNFYNIVGGGGQVMFRRDEVRNLGGYDVAFPSSEDYELWSRMLRHGRIVTLPLVGVRQRDHGARSLSKYAGIKHANWTKIMRGSLTRWLDREVTDAEIASLITVWRHDGVVDQASLADRVMREAFALFRGEGAGIARRRIVKQWREGAANWAKKGNRLEALRYRWRAFKWSFGGSSR